MSPRVAIVGGSLVGMLVWILSVPFLGPSLATLLIVVLAYGILLLARGMKLARSARWGRTVAELVVPLVLWVLFALGGVLASFRVATMRDYGVRFSDSTVLLVAVYALLAATAYMLGFSFLYRNSGQVQVSLARTIPLRRVERVVLLLLVFDWCLRFRDLQRGLYFQWIAKKSPGYAALVRSVPFQIDRMIWPLLLGSLCYLALTSRRKKRLYAGLLLADAGLIFLRGDRSELLLAFVVLTLVFFLCRQMVSGLGAGLVSIVGAMVILLIVSPVIQETRILMRNQADQLLENPSQIIPKFLFEYLPKAANSDVILGGRSASGSRQTLLGRVASYASYADSMYQVHINGLELRPLGDMYMSLQVLIPRVLYPQKTVLDADAAYQAYFGIGTPGHDANGTPYADLLSYTGFPGPLLLFGFLGIGYGALSRWLVRSLGRYGAVVIVGVAPLFIPLGDSFSAYMSNFRNLVLLVPILWLGLKTAFRYRKVR